MWNIWPMHAFQQKNTSILGKTCSDTPTNRHYIIKICVQKWRVKMGCTIHNQCSKHTSSHPPPTMLVTLQRHWHAQGSSQPHSPGWARLPLSSFFPQIPLSFSYFSSNFLHFLPHFGLPGGRLADPERPTGHAPYLFAVHLPGHILRSWVHGLFFKIPKQFCTWLHYPFYMFFIHVYARQDT